MLGIALLASMAGDPLSWKLSSGGLGPIRIGMSEQAVTRLLHGKIEDQLGAGSDDQACHTAVSSFIPSVELMFENGRLSRLALSGLTGIRTTDGFGIATPEQALRRRYQGRLHVTPAEYDEREHSLLLWDKPGKRGLRFLTDVHRRVRIVYAGASSIQYIEGCE